MQVLFDILFPKLCIACYNNLMRNEAHICATCMYELPATNYHKLANNPIEKTFWGRLPLHRAFAYLYFKKDGIVQTILHQIKYKGNKDLAVFMGQAYGGQISEIGFEADALISVPLHEHKLRKRGYNQAALFAKGLSQSTGIPDLSHTVARITATQTQTRKNRFDRWTNVSEVFTLLDHVSLEDKHVVLCDDVITTGATIEALGKVLPTSCKISVCAIATPA